MFSLRDKVAVVTGGASGIGEAIAKTFAAAGAFVYIADRDAKSGKRVAAEINDAKQHAFFLDLDLTDGASCNAVADVVHEEWDRLDILVNNAGIGHVGTILDTSSDDLDRLFAVNVRGMFDLTKAFIPKMVERGYGVIVNVASIGGVVAIQERLAYCTTKFAVVGFTKCLALDHALQGIRANAICPGRVETPFVKARIRETPDPEKAYREMAATQALGRMGTPDEIAAAALYLASDEAAFITGTALEIDGGFAVGK
ncbi:MAG TPA: SDR family oxidoreductase [Pyrinomonadaceae bacterium]|jgi:NAD(P)-dependent dehydrogenase (short-subunit alcohol dehydrogenase family)